MGMATCATPSMPFFASPPSPGSVSALDVGNENRLFVRDIGRPRTDRYHHADTEFVAPHTRGIPSPSAIRYTMYKRVFLLAIAGSAAAFMPSAPLGATTPGIKATSGALACRLAVPRPPCPMGASMEL